MSVHVKDTDHGYRKMRANLKAASKGGGVTVGIHAQEGAAQEQSDAKGPPVTVLDVAIWNEFGFGVPERSFLRAWVDENATVNAEKLRKAMLLVVRGQKTLAQALELIGLSFQGGIQQKIASGIPPANAPSTIAKKGGKTTPLINHGQLRQSVTYKVVDKPPNG